jgi:hypothetical protein
VITVRIADQRSAGIAAPSSYGTGLANPSRTPSWARQLRREQILRGVERVAREGEAGGAGLKPTLRGDDK